MSDSTSNSIKRPSLLVVLAIVLFVPFLVYKTTYNQGLRALNVEGLQLMNLYRYQVREFFGLHQQYVINLISQNALISKALTQNTDNNLHKAQEFIDTLADKNNDEIIVVTNNINRLLSPASSEGIVNELQSGINTLSYNAYGGKNSFVFGFAEKGTKPFYLFGAPIHHESNNVGTVAVMVGLSAIQRRIAHEWSIDDEIVFVSDNYGLIILSSKEEWLYHSINDLPYAVKTDLKSKRGIRPSSMNHIGVARTSTNYGLTTVSNIDETNTDKSTIYLANSVQIPEFKLRVHYLKNISSAQNNAILYTVSSLVLKIAALLAWLYVRTQIVTRRLALAHQATLAQSEAHKQNIINATDSGLISFHAGGSIASMNSACKELLAIDEHSEAENLSQLFTEAHIVDFLSAPNSELTLIRAREVVVKRADNSQFPAQISINEIGIEQPKLWLMTLINISEQKRIESERRRNQKMIAMGMVSTTIAHEINQPLTAIKTEAAIAQKLAAETLPKNIKESLGAIAQFADSIAKVTNQLRSFARTRRPGSNAESNLYQVIQTVHVLFKNRLENEKIGWYEKIYSTDINVKISEQELQQVLTNVIQNACDAMLNSEPKQLEIIAKQQANTVTVSISDTGHGISSEHSNTIFDPFFSTKLSKNSLGLGLAISNDILTQNGAAIHCKNLDNGGACFTLTLLKQR